MNINKCLWLTIVVLLLAATPRLVMAMTDQQKKMLDQLDQLDKLDHLDFTEQKEKADACIRARDFGCAEKRIAKAAKSVSNSQDKKTLSLLKQRLAAERRVAQEELAAAAERERQSQLAEARRQQREQEKDSGPSGWRALAAIGAAAYIGNAAKGYSPEQQTRLMDSTMKGVLNNNMDEFNATSKQVMAERQQQHNAEMQAIREQKDRDDRAAQEQRERNERYAAELRANNERIRQAQINRQQPQVQGYKPLPLAKIDPKYLKPCPPGYYDPAGGQGAACYPIPKGAGSGSQATPGQQTQKVQTQQISSGTSPQNQKQTLKELQAQLAAKQQARNNNEQRLQEQAQQQARDQAQSKTMQGSVLARNTASSGSSKPGGSSTSNAAAGASGGDGINNKEPVKSAAKKVFRKVPNPPPHGIVTDRLTKANGDYNCAAINAYARQYGKDEDRLFNARMDAPYRSDAKCQTRCDLLAWREEIINTFRYSGSWSCSDSAVGLWNGVDAGGDYRWYRDGNNDDNCTCITSSGSPSVFSPKPE